jgi:outer membrane protein TolC
MSDRWAHRAFVWLLIPILMLAAVPAIAQTSPSPTPPPAPYPSTPPPIPAPPPALPALPGPIPTMPPVPAPTPAKPLTLADVVRLALQQSYAIRLAALQVALSRAQLAEALAQLQPTVQGHASYTGTSTPTTTSPLIGTITIPGTHIVNLPFVATIPVTATPQPGWMYGLQLTYPLYTGNALQDQVTIAQATVRGTEAAFAAQAGQTVLAARQGYYGIELAQGQVASAQDAVNASAENVRVTAAEVRVGSVPQFDLLQAEVQLAQAQLNLTHAKASLVQAHQTLDATLNLPLNGYIATTSPLGLPAAPQDVEALVAEGLRQRPEIVQDQANVDAARAAIDLAASGLRPNITLSGGPDIETDNPLTSNPVVWSGMIAMTLTILDGGLTKAKVTAAKVMLQQSQVTLDQTRQTVELQVRTAFLGLENAVEELRSAQTGVVSAREALRIARLRFQAGVGLQLDVVTAIQNLAAAEDAVVQGLYDYDNALAELDQAIGIQVTI